MKIQDTLLQNKNYWEEQAKALEQLLGKHQEEVQRIALELNNAQEQIALYDKAQQFLVAQDQKATDTIDAEVPVDVTEAQPIP